ncbi:hypothetical protein K523DRAFT_319469 [Schizophyllum commune Tattone D]|nr:hypothetical protein K523DRAFT_319469 [Schizophyllum commune Tattone D]
MYATINRLFILVAAALLAAPALAAPAPHATMQASNDYSGAGGMAPGGSVNHAQTDKEPGLLGLGNGESLLNAFSGNAGNGGDSSSGSSGVSRLTGAKAHCTRDNAKEHWRRTITQTGNAYSGAGGNAAGGATDGESGLINLWSDNAGDGGNGGSGTSGC